MQLIVKDLQLKMAGLIQVQKDLFAKLQKQNIEKQQFKEDIHNLKEHDEDFKMLRKKVVAMYKKWVNN